MSSIVRKAALVASVLVLVPLTQPAPGSAAARAYVRVNQVGYVKDGPKQAFLLSTHDHGGEPFDLVGDGGVVAFSGTIGADRGAWNDRYGHVNQIGFDAFADPGVYVLEAAGATSPPFEIGSGSAVFDHLLSNALAFFQEQHDGRHVVPGLLDRKPSHLNDAHATAYETPVYVNGHLSQPLVPTGTVDVEGGWFDAGDYIKFVHTAAFVEVPMQLALRDDASLFTNGGPNFRAEAKFGLRWLLKMIDVDRGVVYYQVGIGNGGLGYNSDHDVWRLPEVDDAHEGPCEHVPRAPAGLPRRDPRGPPSFRRSPAGWRRRSDSVPRSSRAPIRRSRTAVSAPARQRSRWRIPATPRTTPPLRAGTTQKGRCGGTTWSSAPSSCTWRCETRSRCPRVCPLPIAATYLGDAAHWARAYLKQSAELHDTFNLYDVSRTRARRADPRVARCGRSDGSAGVVRRSAGRARSAARPRRRGRCRGPVRVRIRTRRSRSARVRVVGRGGVVRPGHGTSRFADLQASQLSWALGANAWGSTFVIGAGSVFPHCPQDQPANIVGSLDGTGNIMLGGGVDGPSDYIPDRVLRPGVRPALPT